MLRKNGMRHPQAKNWSPEIALNASAAKFARNRPDGTPNCGQAAIKPRWWSDRAHSIDISTEPPHSPPTPTPWIKRRTVSKIAAPTGRATKADGVNGEGLQCSDQRIGFRKIQLREDQPSDRAVEKKIIP